MTNPSVIFLVPLKGRAASRNWDRVAALARRTLESVCEQAGAASMVVLIHNEDSDPGYRHQNLLRVPVGLPAPDASSTARMADKWAKLRIGLERVRQFLPAHIMVVDADDCVHSNLTKFVSENLPECSWYVERGYLHEEGSAWLVRRRRFHLFCGSSCVVWTTPEDVPGDIVEGGSPCVLLDYGHTAIVSQIEFMGRPIRPLPFPAVIYSTGTGENDSGISLRSLGSRKKMLLSLLAMRPFTRSLRASFHCLD